MATARVGTSATAIAGGVALAMAAGAALVLAAADAIWVSMPTADDAGLSLLVILGWALAVWASLIAVAVAVHLVRRLATRQRIAPIAIALVVATGVVIAGVVLLHPLAGSGGASASRGDAGERSVHQSVAHVAPLITARS